jgi:hypothetical protein
MCFIFTDESLSLQNHTGLFTTLPTYSYHPLQTFFTQSDVAILINKTVSTLGKRRLSPIQGLQAAMQLDMLSKGKVGQIEMVPFAGTSHKTALLNHV